MEQHNQNLEMPSEKCPCGKVGRFWLNKRVGDIKLCLDCMQYWLTEKLSMDIGKE